VSNRDWVGGQRGEIALSKTSTIAKIQKGNVNNITYKSVDFGIGLVLGSGFSRQKRSANAEIEMGWQKMFEGGGRKVGWFMSKRGVLLVKGGKVSLGG
jgi:hypothetical protein